MVKVGEIEVDFNPEALLEAISLVESLGGHNNHPRFEVAYAPEGKYFTIQGKILRGTGRNFNKVVAERWEKWGMRSACSYGPYQIMYHTAADNGYNGPPESLTNPSISKDWAWILLRRIVERGARSVEQVADAWNSGSHRDAYVPHDYIAKVQRAYATLTMKGVDGGIEA